MTAITSYATPPSSGRPAAHHSAGHNPAAPASAAGVPSRSIVRLVQDTPALHARLESVLRAGHGRVLSRQAALHLVVVEADAATTAALARLDGVGGVAPDSTAKAASLGLDPASQPGSMTNVTRVTGAQNAWRKGYTGAGVDVAVIDTGVAPVAALADPAKVVVGPDLSFESQLPTVRYLDSFGHGTHMSTIIGGREVPKASGSVYAADTRNFYGMAPDSRIVSLKVGDHNGSADVSQLVAAIDWVVQNRKAGGLNIRVLNLSFGTDSTQPYTLDPLSYAAEVAWNAGILVVVSGGNDGARSAGLADPAYNSNLFAIGAVDTRGTDTMADDTVAPFSQHPNSTLFKREPDLVAPGVRILAPGVPGSKLYTSNPTARFGNDLIRGSGTSQAAATVSGAAALLFQKWPSMSPADAKELLTRTATKLPNTSSALQGRGELNVSAALDSVPMSNPLFAVFNTLSKGVLNLGFLPATGLGTLDAARGTHRVSMEGVTLAGERDIMSRPWVNSNIVKQTLSKTMWGADGTFNGTRWIGAGFAADSTTWAGKTWSGRTWQSTGWTASAWDGKTWSGRTWQSGTWDGKTWLSADWSNGSSSGFSSAVWSSTAWG